VVRPVPNPVAFGRCASINVEPQDADGYRATSMSNGQPIDPRRFTYDADTTNFQWTGRPAEARLCPRMPGTPSQVTVTVTFPDGLSGSAVLLSVAPGTEVLAVQYAPQAPLRGYGTPQPRQRATAVGLTAGEAAGPSAGASAAPAPGPATSPLGTRAPPPTALRPQVVQAAGLGMTGTGLALQALFVDGAPLGMTGAGLAFQPLAVTAGSLGMVGNGLAPVALVVDAAPLAMTGTGIAFSPLSVVASPLSMIGQKP
jgi:hypothetical protein